MSNLQHYCHDCTHWKWDDTIHLPDGSSAYPGHCGLYSIRCVNAVADGETPPNFQSMKETYKEEVCNTEL